jgi:hypothetical protein
MLCRADPLPAPLDAVARAGPFGPGPSPDAVARFENDHVAAGTLQHTGGSEPRQSRSDDDYVDGTFILFAHRAPRLPAPRL